MNRLTRLLRLCFGTGRFRLAALLLMGLVAYSGPAAAHDPTKPAGPFIPGPYTIKGQVLDPKGRPLAGYPVRLLPVLPGKGVDVDNIYYKIPNRDEHKTVTDANGRFVMTKVIDYPQVKGRIYRIAQANFDKPFPYAHVFSSDVVPLDRITDPSGVLELVIKTEPAAQVRLVVKTKSGRPFTGTRTLSIATGHGRRITRPVDFANGVAVFMVPPGDVQTPGRIVLLPWKNAAEARREAAEAGRPVEGQGRQLVTTGALGQKSVVFLPGQTITVEMTVNL